MEDFIGGDKTVLNPLAGKPAPKSMLINVPRLNQKEVIPMVWKPSEKEEEYFARMEFERRKKLEEEKHGKLKKEDKKRLKELHYMRCPKCGMDLIEIDYRKIKIDRCSGCEGVWLDAGELETVAGFEKAGLDRFFSIFKR